VATAPDAIDLARDRDLVGRRWHPWIRKSLVVLVSLFLLAGLLNVFGQRPSGVETENAAARLKVYSPTRVRGGLIWEARITVEAKRSLEKANLVLSEGWLEGMTLNTMEPSPVGEASRNGSLALDLGHIPARQRYTLFMQFQVNPTNVGRRSNDVELFDGNRKLLSIHRVMTVFP
jgi:hypothetical protein